MVYFKENLEQKFNKLTADNYYVVIDFDGTITDSYMGSWYMFSVSPAISQAYKNDAMWAFEAYSPKKYDPTIGDGEREEIMHEWWVVAMSLFVKHKITRRQFEEVVYKSGLNYRRGAEDFLKTVNDKKIPTMILSAGVGNFIEIDLKKREIYADNIKICSNFFYFNNDITIGLSQNIIHLLNKNDVVIDKEFLNKIKNKQTAFLFGDNLGDIKMIADETKRDCAIKIGFCEKENMPSLQKFKELFDIVCTENTSFNELQKQIFERYKFKF